MEVLRNYLHAKFDPFNEVKKCLSVTNTIILSLGTHTSLKLKQYSQGHFFSSKRTIFLIAKV